MTSLTRFSPALTALPALVIGAGERAEIRFLEFFASTIRNPHTRRAYARAVTDFLTWCADAGVATDDTGYILTGPDLLHSGQRPPGWPLDRDPLGNAACLDGWMEWEPWFPDYAYLQWLKALHTETAARSASEGGER